MSGKKMNQLIQSSLYYAQVGNNIKKEECSIRQIVQNIQINLIQQLVMKNIKFRVDYQNLPQVIISDKTLITNVFINLVSNSIKACNKNKQSFIQIGSHNKDWIYVKDNGIGMTKYQKQKMFNLFYKSSNTSQGLGLGMTIVKRILQKLNSTIIVQTEKEKGTTFFFNVQIPKIIKEIKNEQQTIH